MAWTAGARRAAAIVAFGAAAITSIAVLVILVDNIGFALLALAGLALGGAAGWYVATSSGVVRLASAAGIVLAVAVVVWAMARAVDPSTALVRLGVVAVGSVVATAAARIAVGTGHHTVFVRTQVPLRPVLVCNPRSGGGTVGEHHLVERATAMGVDAVLLEDGVDLEQLARDAVAAGADCLGMAGGDGSQALVASVAVDAGLPFVCVAAGTRNH